MTQRSAADDTPRPPRRNPDALLGTIIGLCLQDTIFASQAQQWCAARPGASTADYIHALTKPHRDAGALPDFINAASYAAFVLALAPDLAEDWR
ncbi:MAG: hypothetical protein C0519_15825 [Hyphomicrobium sp.]|nr:hypothetical protein [Hyphomicrobium sp.]PPD05922.1 MAG: hypothetical protein CTY28_15615 [Hyphomicrobium sp.]